MFAKHAENRFVCARAIANDRQTRKDTRAFSSPMFYGDFWLGRNGARQTATFNSCANSFSFSFSFFAKAMKWTEFDVEQRRSERRKSMNCEFAERLRNAHKQLWPKINSSSTDVFCIARVKFRADETRTVRRGTQ